MKRTSFWFFLVIAVTIVVNPADVLCQVSTEKAVAAAEEWLNLVDEGKYQESWDGAAKYFQGAVTKEQWESSLNAHRKPLGKLLTRKLKSSEYRTTLPGAPDGEYVVIQFESSFENKKSAIETVTPMLEEEGSWKVSGYYIK
ncbi:MAG: DUF4019 domain-containing protein [Candidatus Glassbacteria bacterium]